MTVETHNEQGTAVGRCLTFMSGVERFAVNIVMVREIVGSLPTTRVPGLPPEVRGVTNLRGRVLPVFDFRRLAGTAADQLDPDSPSIVIVIDVDGTPVGVVADQVLGVVPASDIAFREMPEVDLQVDRRFLRGVCMVEDEMHILIELDQLISSTGFVADNH